ncbi:MAG: carbohydrate ABC transporter permease [Monoglobaceae bacterium]
MKKKNEKLTGVILPTELRSPKVRTFHIVVHTILIVFVTVSVFPILWLMLSAFKDTKEFYQVPATIIPQSFHPEYIPKVWNMVKFGNAYLSTVGIMVGTCAVSLICNGMTGYTLALLKPRGIKYLSAFILWTMMIPTSINSIPLFMTFVDFPVFHWNLSNSYIPMWVMAGANCFNILLFKSFFSGIPREYLEAARIDGCSEGGMFFRIVMPLSKPIIVTVMVFSATGAISNFFWPYLLISEKSMQPVSLALYSLKGTVAENEYMIALLFVIVPSALLFIFFQKYIMQGASIGGIKG